MSSVGEQPEKMIESPSAMALVLVAHALLLSGCASPTDVAKQLYSDDMDWGFYERHWDETDFADEKFPASVKWEHRGETASDIAVLESDAGLWVSPWRMWRPPGPRRNPYAVALESIGLSPGTRHFAACIRTVGQFRCGRFSFAAKAGKRYKLGTWVSSGEDSPPNRVWVVDTETGEEVGGSVLDKTFRDVLRDPFSAAGTTAPTTDNRASADAAIAGGAAGTAAGVAAGMAICTPSALFPPAYAACVATWGLGGAAAGVVGGAAVGSAVSANIGTQCQRARRGDANAIYAVGWHNESLESDYVEALKWYLLAKRAGVETAKYRIEYVSAVLTPSEQAEAERRATAWSPDGGACP